MSARGFFDDLVARPNRMQYERSLEHRKSLVEASISCYYE